MMEFQRLAIAESLGVALTRSYESFLEISLGPSSVLANKQSILRLPLWRGRNLAV